MNGNGNTVSLQQLKEEFEEFDRAYREQVNPEGTKGLYETRLVLDRLRGCGTPYEAYEQDAKARRGMEYEKVIFLDVDGVLNDDHYRKGRRLDDDKMACLKQIVDATGAVIVLSSSWRFSFREYFDYLEVRDRSDPAVLKGARAALVKDEGEDSDCVALLDMLEQNGMRLAGYTRDISSGPSSRPLEIRVWLMDKPFVKSFVILDDDDFWGWGWLGRHFVRTQTPSVRKADRGDASRGLTEFHAKEAIHVLNEYTAAGDLHPDCVKKWLDEHAGMEWTLEELCDAFCVDTGLMMRETAKLGYDLKRTPHPPYPGEKDDRALMWQADRCLEMDRTLSHCRIKDSSGYYMYSTLIDLLSGGAGVYKSKTESMSKMVVRHDYDKDRSRYNVIFVCLDGILNDGKPESAGQIDMKRVQDVAKLSKATGAGIVLYAEGYDSVKAFFAAQDKISFNADSREKQIAKLRAETDEECRQVLDMFDAANAPLYGMTEFYSDDGYGLPYSVKEWLCGHPKEYGFVVLTAQTNSVWGWMYEHAVVCGRYYLDALQAAAEILASRPSVMSGFSLNWVQRLL